MKILIVATDQFGAGGITSSIMNYYRNIDHKEFHFDFVAQNDVDGELKSTINKYGSKLFVIGGRKRNPIKYMMKLKKCIEKGNYDAIHVHGNSATMAFDLIPAKLAGCRIRIAHSHNTMSKYKLLDKLLRPAFYQTCNVRFACGRDAGKWLFRGRDFRVIKNGCNTREYIFNSETRQAIRKKFDLENVNIIGQVGNLNEQKNHKFTLDVLKKIISEGHDGCKLVVAGDGKYMDDLKNLAVQKGLSEYVMFMGNIDNVNEWYQAFDCLVLPSKHEGFPMVMVESQLAGLKCIVSDKVTHDADITKTAKFLPINDNSQLEWAKAVEKVCQKSKEHTDDRNKIAYEAASAGYDIKPLAKELEKIYIELSKEIK